jgi:beta-phosphoglucomutase
MSNSDTHAVIWDVDGTLVDTAELHFQAWVKVARKLNKPFTRADFAATFGRRNPEILHQLFGEEINAQEVADLGTLKEDLYRDEARKGVDLLPGVRPLLEGLHGAGFLQAIGSSAPLRNIELIMSLTQTAPFFSAVSSMEDTERGKPDPQVFQVAAAKLRVPSECCLVMEDAVAGVEAAKAGGMKCIAVRFVGHHPAEKLAAAGADRVVRTLEEVSVGLVQQLLR